jgi:hypothetical protein
MMVSLKNEPKLLLGGQEWNRSLMAKYHLFRWKLVYGTMDPYVAPEMRGAKLFGFRDQEDKPVLTSQIVSCNGREVTTRSGSVYILEDIDVDYRQWIDDNQMNYDPDNPIKFIKR